MNKIISDALGDDSDKDPDYNPARDDHEDTVDFEASESGEASAETIAGIEKAVDDSNNLVELVLKDEPESESELSADYHSVEITPMNKTIEQFENLFVCKECNYKTKTKDHYKIHSLKH